MTHVPALIQIFSYSMFSFLVALILTKPFVRLLYKYKIGKKIRAVASDGKAALLFEALHLKKSGTPTMGGILIWGTTLFVVLFSRLLSYFGLIEKSLLDRGEVYLPLFTLISMGFLGALDDYYNVKELGKSKGINIGPKFILLVLFGLLGGLWFYYKLGYSSIHVPSVGDFDIGMWYIPLFTLVIVATANAVNITDGLDGLAGGLLIIAFTAFTLLAYLKGHTTLAIFCGVINGSLLAFLWFNLPPALFYMGDTGSLSLGATLGVIAMMTDTMLVLPLIGFIFVVETMSVIIQLTSKKFFGKKVFKIAPIHHHFEHKKWGEAKIVMRFWMIGGMFTVIGLIIGIIGMGD